MNAWLEMNRFLNLAAAVELGCTTLYSEDLNHGQSYDGVRVVNPFLG